MKLENIAKTFIAPAILFGYSVLPGCTGIPEGDAPRTENPTRGTRVRSERRVTPPARVESVPTTSTTTSDIPPVATGTMTINADTPVTATGTMTTGYVPAAPTTTSDVANALTGTAIDSTLIPGPVTGTSTLTLGTPEPVSATPLPLGQESTKDVIIYLGKSDAGTELYIMQVAERYFIGRLDDVKRGEVNVVSDSFKAAVQNVLKEKFDTSDASVSLLEARTGYLEDELRNALEKEFPAIAKAVAKTAERREQEAKYEALRLQAADMRNSDSISLDQYRAVLRGIVSNTPVDEIRATYLSGPVPAALPVESFIAPPPPPPPPASAPPSK